MKTSVSAGRTLVQRWWWCESLLVHSLDDARVQKRESLPHGLVIVKDGRGLAAKGRDEFVQHGVPEYVVDGGGGGVPDGGKQVTINVKLIKHHPAQYVIEGIGFIIIDSKNIIIIYKKGLTYLLRVIEKEFFKALKFFSFLDNHLDT